MYTLSDCIPCCNHIHIIAMIVINNTQSEIELPHWLADDVMCFALAGIEDDIRTAIEKMRHSSHLLLQFRITTALVLYVLQLLLHHPN